MATVIESWSSQRLSTICGFLRVRDWINFERVVEQALRSSPMGPEKAARCGATEANRSGSQHQNCRQKAEEVDTQSCRGVGRGATDLRRHPPAPDQRSWPPGRPTTASCGRRGKRLATKPSRLCPRWVVASESGHHDRMMRRHPASADPNYRASGALRRTPTLIRSAWPRGVSDRHRQADEPRARTPSQPTGPNSRHRVVGPLMCRQAGLVFALETCVGRGFRPALLATALSDAPRRGQGHWLGR